jgi:hypothetical protein
MHNRKLRILGLATTLLIGCANISAGYPKKCPSVKELAKTFVQMEFHGRRSPKHESCLKKVKSEAVWVRPEQNDEAMNKAPKVSRWVDSLDSLKIDKVAKTEVNERFKVEFSYKDGKKDVKDSLILETYEGTMKKMVGCAAIVEPPKELALLKSCQ